MPDVTAAPTPVWVGGVEYSLRPLADADFDELDNWWRGTMIDMARRSLLPTYTQEERDEIIGAAVREAHKITCLSKDGTKDVRVNILRTMRIAWQGLRKSHPHLTFDEFARNAKEHPQDLKEFMRVWAKVNFGITEEDKKEDEPHNNGAPKEPESPGSKTTSSSPEPTLDSPRLSSPAA